MMYGAETYGMKKPERNEACMVYGACTGEPRWTECQLRRLGQSGGESKDEGESGSEDFEMV